MWTTALTRPASNFDLRIFLSDLVLKMIIYCVADQPSILEEELESILLDLENLS